MREGGSGKTEGLSLDKGRSSKHQKLVEGAARDEMLLFP